MYTEDYLNDAYSHVLRINKEAGGRVTAHSYIPCGSYDFDKMPDIPLIHRPEKMGGGHPDHLTHLHLVVGIGTYYLYTVVDPTTGVELVYYGRQP